MSPAAMRAADSVRFDQNLADFQRPSVATGRQPALKGPRAPASQLAHDHATARANHARELLQRRHRIGHEAEYSHRRHGIERIARERKRTDIRVCETDREASSTRSVSGDTKHLIAHVDPDDGRNMICEACGEPSITAPRVEHAPFCHWPKDSEHRTLLVHPDPQPER